MGLGKFLWSKSTHEKSKGFDKMIRSELNQTMAYKCGLIKKEATAAVDIVFERIADSLADGGRVELRGFGSFFVKQYDARKGRNPKTGELINVPAKRLVAFRTGKTLRERVDR